MNLLFVVHYPVFGGPHNQALRLNEALRERGWNTFALLPTEPGNAAERLREGGVTVIQTPLHRVRAAKNPRLQAAFAAGFIPEISRIRRIIRENRIDLVLIGGLINPHAGIAARLEKVPVAWQILDISTPMPVWRLLRPIVTRCADSVMSAGRVPAKLYLGEEQAAIPTFAFYPPVDTGRFRPSADTRRRVREELAIPEGAPLVGAVANLNPEKGIEYFVRSAAMIYQSEPECRFVIVGASYATHREYLERIRAEVQASPIPGEQFIFAGERANVEDYFVAMDVDLLTSIREAAPTTVMEAMSCGVPVVASDVGSVNELLQHGESGFVVQAQNPAATASSVLKLLRNRDLRQSMGQAARKRAVERFDVQACADVHVSAFEAAMTARECLLTPRRDEVRT